MKEYKFGVDIDGVILDTYTPWLNILNNLRGTDYCILDVVDYDLKKVFGVPKKQICDMFSCIDDREIELMDPNCPQVIDKLRAEGFMIELITAHIPHVTYCQDDLLASLDKHKINYDRISFVELADHNAKGKLAHLFDYMVDDSSAQVNAMADETKAILYEAPYNIYKSTPKAWARVQTWSRLEHLLLGDILND